MFQKAKRRRFFVDSRVQGALILRLVVYWAAFLVSFVALFTLWTLFLDPLRPIRDIIGDVAQRSLPAIVASLWLLPIVVYDLIKTSNRFVGPVLRLRNALGELAKGGEPRKIEFRKGDFWRELATELNRVSDRLATAEKAAKARQPEQVEEEVAV